MRISLKGIIGCIVAALVITGAVFFLLQSKDKESSAQALRVLTQSQKQASGEFISATKGAYKVDGKKVDVFVSNGRPVGCEDKLLRTEQHGSNTVLYIQGTSGRTKDMSESIVTVQFDKAIAADSIQVRITNECEEK